MFFQGLENIAKNKFNERNAIGFIIRCCYSFIILLLIREKHIRHWKDLCVDLFLYQLRCDCLLGCFYQLTINLFVVSAV